MIISFKRISIAFVLILSLAISPVFIPNTNTVHAAKQDDLANIANSKIGKTAGHFGFGGGWCSKFVWWAAGQAGIMNGKTLPKKSVGGTNDIQSYYTKKGQYHKATKKFKPQKGDLAIFGSSTHVGIVTKAKGKYVWITHGNWAGKVRKTKIKKSGYDGGARAKIKGYVRLDYKASEPKVKVNFNANGGTVNTASKKIRNTDKIGILPDAQKKSCTFVGWFTKPEGGKLVTDSYKVDVKKSITVYAQYTIDKPRCDDKDKDKEKDKDKDKDQEDQNNE